MWILCVTAAIAFVAGEMAVLVAVCVLGISSSRSTEDRRSSHPVHTDTPESPGNATGYTQPQEGALGRWSYPSRNGHDL